MAKPLEPTPGQITDECRAIRAGWSAETELSRRAAGFRRVEFSVPGADRHGEVVDAETLHGFAGEN